MNTPQRSSAPDRTSLLIDFPVRLYTALRTIRLYPASNPQVHRSNDFVLKAFQALLKSGKDDSVNIALSDQKIWSAANICRTRIKHGPRFKGSLPC